MEKIRKGNDIEVQWAIYVGQGINEAPYDLTGRRLSLYLRNQFGRQEVYEYSIDKHVIRFMYWGKDQKQTGTYSIELVENEGIQGMHTVDECDAFNLVNHSCQTGGDSEGRVECIHLQFRANMGITVPMIGAEIKVDDALSLESENPVQNKVITTALNEKQDYIVDLDFIRAGAAKGATALQEVPSEYITENELDEKGYLTEHQSLEHLATKEELNRKVDKVEGKQLSTEDFTSDQKSKLESLHNYDDAEVQKDIDDIKATAIELDAKIFDNKTRIDATATNVIDLTGRVDVLTGTGEGSVQDTVSKEVAKVVASAPEDLDTLREIADFIEADSTQAANIITTLDDHNARIADLEQRSPEVVMMTQSQYDMLPDKGDKIYYIYEE